MIRECPPCKYPCKHWSMLPDGSQVHHHFLMIQLLNFKAAVIFHHFYLFIIESWSYIPKITAIAGWLYQRFSKTICIHFAAFQLVQQGCKILFALTWWLYGLPQQLHTIAHIINWIWGSIGWKVILRIWKVTFLALRRYLWHKTVPLIRAGSIHGYM